MFNILNNKGNANKTDTEIPFTSSECLLPKQTTANVSEDAVEGQRSPHTLLVGMQISAATVEISIEVLQKIKNRTAV
jgi:hypothetical protein